MPRSNAIQSAHNPRLIEADHFPFDFLSAIAERESWRKEVYRPIYHIHKWWAKRLGSVFRGVILGSLLPEDANLEQSFYEQHDFSGVSVFDPFMGSGTTVGEAHSEARAHAHRSKHLGNAEEFGVIPQPVRQPSRACLAIPRRPV